MKNLFSIGLASIIVECAALLSATGADSGIPAGQNIAQGKSYMTNIIPTKTWRKSLKTIPDYDKILTDGTIEKSASGSFWVSPKCANFTGTTNVDVIVDLGQEMPVSGIFARHGARPSAGICLPRKEEYFVSDDGVKFYKAGEFNNQFDDYSLKNELEIKKNFANGIKQYGVDNLKTKGRYIMIRTYGSGIGNAFGTYVGYDEIFVIKGDFPLSQASRNEENVVSLKKVDLPESVLGYRVNPPDWRKIAQKQPLFLALAPMQFIGDNEYQLSASGTYVMPFAPAINTTETISDITLSCELPSSIKLVSYNNSSKLESSKPTAKDGNLYMSYSFSITQPEKFLKSYMYYPYLVVQSQNSSPGNAGKCYYTYSYTTGGKKYTHSNSFNITVVPKITAVAPKRFITGFWLPYQARFLEDKQDAENDIIGFYRSLGFNCLNGGDRSKESFDASHKNWITVYGGSGYDNGLMLAGETIPDDEQFKYYPSKIRKGVVGVCPTLLCASPKYSNLLKQKFAKALTESDHIYSNWEPYMFMKQGCICDRCKQEFQKFSGVNDDELNKIWPACVIDKENKLHNNFSSYQYGNLVKQAQKLTREAGTELKLKHKPDFMIAYEPSFVDPDKSWFKTHNHGEFYKDIDMTIMWSYPNTIQLDAFDLKLIPGNTLAQLPADFANAKKIVTEAGRKEGSGEYPKIFFMGTEYMLNYLVMPKDYYFMSLLCFFSGLDGYGTWSTHFKCDARYAALNAKANTLISKLEDIVMDGEKTDNAKIKIISPAPEKISGKTLTLSTVKAFEYNGKKLVAVGNDHIARIYVNLQINGLSGGNYRLYDCASKKVYQPTADTGYSASELANGVIIPVDGKSWAALLIGNTPENATEYTTFTADAVKKQFAKDTPKMKAAMADFR